MDVEILGTFPTRNRRASGPGSLAKSWMPTGERQAGSAAPVSSQANMWPYKCGILKLIVPLCHTWKSCRAPAELLRSQSISPGVNRACGSTQGCSGDPGVWSAIPLSSVSLGEISSLPWFSRCVNEVNVGAGRGVVLLFISPKEYIWLQLRWYERVSRQQKPQNFGIWALGEEVRFPWRMTMRRKSQSTKMEPINVRDFKLAGKAINFFLLAPCPRRPVWREGFPCNENYMMSPWRLEWCNHHVGTGLMSFMGHWKLPANWIMDYREHFCYSRKMGWI